MNKQPWIHSPTADFGLILAPAFVSLGFVAILPNLAIYAQDTPLWAWVIFVMFIDVAHVHSTFFKTYFNRASLARHQLLYGLVPVVSYLLFVGIYWAGSSEWFWRVLAYLAVFHFVRQPYGFVRIYNRTDGQPRWAHRLDEFTIYAATLLPVLHWHLNSPRYFSWFVANDFYFVSWPWLRACIVPLYALVVGVYVLKELWRWHKNAFNWPRFLFVIGTILSWYLGIVYFNNDLVFTVLNVVAHGIPYIGLVWFDLHKSKSKVQGISRLLFTKVGLPLFLATILVFAVVEESLWDAAIWRQYGALFSGLYGFVPAVTSDGVLCFLVPLLALPQITHYVLDGFIWRRDFA
jgi:hypothetical protein